MLTDPTEVKRLVDAAAANGHGTEFVGGLLKCRCGWSTNELFLSADAMEAAAQRHLQGVEPVVPRTWQERLDSIERTCSVANWDSYGARPVSVQAIQVAALLGTFMDLSPHNDGGISVTLASEGIDIELDHTGRIKSFFVDLDDVNKWVEAMQARAGLPREGDR